MANNEGWDISRGKVAWKRDEVDIVIQLCKSGNSFIDIAKKQQRSFNAIQLKIEDIIWEMVSRNMTITDISSELNIPAPHVSDIIRKRMAEENKKASKLGLQINAPELSPMQSLPPTQQSATLLEYAKLQYESSMRIEILLNQLITLQIRRNI